MKTIMLLYSVRISDPTMIFPFALFSCVIYFFYMFAIEQIMRQE